MLTLEEAQAPSRWWEAEPNVAGVEFITTQEAMEDFQEDKDLSSGHPGRLRFQAQIVIHLTDISL